MDSVRLVDPRGQARAGAGTEASTQLGGTIDNNAILTSITALSGLTTVGGNGLGKLVSAGSIVLPGNALLADISALGMSGLQALNF